MHSTSYCIARVARDACTVHHMSVLAPFREPASASFSRHRIPTSLPAGITIYSIGHGGQGRVFCRARQTARSCYPGDACRGRGHGGSRDANPSDRRARAEALGDEWVVLPHACGAPRGWGPPRQQAAQHAGTVERARTLVALRAQGLVGLRSPAGVCV